MITVTPQEFAEKLGGFTPQIIRRYCVEGMPGSKKDKRGHWKINPKKAKPWIIRRGKNIQARQPIKIKKRSQKNPRKIPKESPENPGSSSPSSSPASSSSLTRIERMELRLDGMGTLLDAMTQIGVDGNLDPRLSKMHKEYSSEQRELMKLIRQEREAEGKIVDREHHDLVVITFATRFKETLDYIPKVAPDRVISHLSDGGEEHQDPKLALRLITESLTSLIDEIKNRLSSDYEEARRGR